MKLKFEQTISELGIQDAKFSKGILNGIKEINQQKVECEKLSSNLVGYHESDRDELEAELETQLDVLNVLDERLAEKISFWDSKKEVYAANAQKLADYRAGKPAAEKPKGAIADAKPPKAKVVKTQVSEERVGEELKELVDYKELPKYEQPLQQEEEKKPSNWTWWVLAGIVGVATLGAVVMKRK